MWLLNALLYGVLFLGYGVILYALAVGVKGLYSKVRADRKELAEFHAWMANYEEWYDVNECEQNYYADWFEGIIGEWDGQVCLGSIRWDDQVLYNVDEIMAALRSYVDGVRSSKVVK